MDDIQYKIGAMEAEIKALTKTIEKQGKTLEEMNIQVMGWKSQMTGAIIVLSIIGSIALKFAGELIGLFRFKVGM